LWKIEYLANGQEKITNQTKKIHLCETEPIERAFGESNSSSISPVMLLLSVSSHRFGASRPFFAINPTSGDLEMRQ